MKSPLYFILENIICNKCFTKNQNPNITGILRNSEIKCFNCDNVIITRGMMPRFILLMQQSDDQMGKILKSVGIKNWDSEGIKINGTCRKENGSILIQMKFKAPENSVYNEKLIEAFQNFVNRKKPDIPNTA